MYWLIYLSIYFFIYVSDLNRIELNYSKIFDKHIYSPQIMVPGRYCELGRHLQEVHRACAAAMCPDHSHHFWEVPWCFTYRNITDRLGISGFYRPMDHGKFQLGIPIKLNNPELRVLCPVFLGQTSTFFLSPRSSTVLPTPRVTDEIFKATPFETYKGVIDREETYLEALGERFDLSTFYGNDWVLTSACRSHQILWKHLGSNFSLQIPSNCMETIGFQL